jgi:predicted PurR-regulated permease PerM
MAFYALLQFAEGNFIVPMVMKKAVGISPIVTIVSMLIGWEFLGIMGMILAVPIASVLSLFVYDFSSREKRTFQKRPVEPQKNEKHKQKKKGL